MGQNECLKLLNKESDWITTRQIADKLEQSPGLVNRSLKRLYETGFIKRRNVKINNSSTKYEYSKNG